MYGPADHGHSADFRAELKTKVERCTISVVVAGDFNLIRWASDQSLPNVDRVRMRLFNDCIADLALCEIARVGARSRGRISRRTPSGVSWIGFLSRLSGR